MDKVAVTRKGATSVKAVPAQVLSQLEQGSIETVTLAETLAVDFGVLAQQVFPDLPAAALTRIRSAGSQGVTVSMRVVGDELAAFFSEGEHAVGGALAGEPERARSHTSDIVRGWLAYTVPAELPLAKQLLWMRPFAADRHFGVREWAWLALRGPICAAPFEALETLQEFASEADPYLRRFASEATRPRGVWATHIKEFKCDPSPALAILDRLCLDEDDYVHRSVANWLRDAGKTTPDWVNATLSRWESEHGTHARIDALRKRSLASSGNRA